MENLENLFNVLSERGLTTKSFDEFVMQYQDETYQNKVFDVVSAKGLFDGNIQSFKTKYSSQSAQPGDSAKEKQKNVSWFDQTWFGRGVAAASTTGEAMDLWMEGSNVNMETIQDFIEAKEQEAKKHVPSDRMQRFQKQYKKEGETWSAFFRGVKRDPALMAELFVQSLGTQFGTAIDAPESLAAAGVGAATGAGIGAAATAYGFGVGAIPGALAGAMGGLASTMETALTFGELIDEELKKEGKAFTDKNIKALLEGPKGQSIRNKSIGRGLTIGAIEGLSGGIAGKVAVGAKTAVKTGRRATLAGIGAGVGVEAIGGATGEVAGRAVAGQEMDPAEIGFEAFTGMSTAPLNITAAMLSHKPPVYKLNGENVTHAEMKDFIDTADEIDIAKANIEMENDVSGLDAKAYEKQNRAIIDSQIDEKITDPKDRKELVDYEIKRKLKEFEAQKKGVDKVPNAAEELATIEAEIEAIIGKYEGAVGIYETQTEEAKAVRKTRRDISLEKTIDFLEKNKGYAGKDVVIAEDSDAAQIAHDKAVEEYNAKNPDDQLPIEDVSEADGFIVGDVIVINKDVAGRKGAINVGAHELLHGVIAKHMRGLSVTEKTKLISSFKNTITSEQRSYIENRLNESYKKQIKADKNWINTTDEWLTIFSDGITQGDITFNEGVFDKMKNVLQKILRKLGIKKEFANGRQVYDFMKDYQASIEKNQLSTRAQKLAGGGVGVSGVKASISAAGGAAEIAASYRGRGKSTITKEQRARITDNVNALGESYEIEGVGNKAWEEGGATQAIEEIKENGYLDALIHAQYKAETVPKNFVKDVITELTKHIKNYKPESQLKVDPSKRTGLFGWVNAQIGNRASRVYNEIYKQREEDIGAKDVGAVTTEGAPVVQVAAEKDVRVKKFEEEDILKEQLREQRGEKKAPKPIPKADRVRVLNDLSDVEIQNMGEVNATIVAEVDALIEQNPKNLEQKLETLIEKEFAKIILENMGGISKVEGKTVVSEEYKAWHALGYNDIISALSDDVIKNNYKTLFDIEKVSREKDKKVNPITGKVTYPGKGIYKVKTNKVRWTKFFTEGGHTTLLARRKGLAKLIAKAKAKQAVDSNIETNSTDADKKIDAKLRAISASLDNQSNQIRSFDSVQFSITKDFVKAIELETERLYKKRYKGKKLFISKGHALEQAIINHIKKLNIPGLEALVEVATEVDGMADVLLSIVIGGEKIAEFGVEIKKGTKNVRLTSNRISSYNVATGEFTIDNKDPYVGIFDRNDPVKKGKKYIKAYYKEANETITRWNEGQTVEVNEGTKKNPRIVKYKRRKGEPKISLVVDGSKNAMPTFAHQSALDKGLGVDVTNNTTFEVDMGLLVKNTYASKKHPSQYIEFLGNFFSLGEDLIFGGDVPVLAGVASINVEMGSSGTLKPTDKGRYTHQMKKDHPGIKFVTVGPRIMPKPKQFTSKAKGSITDGNYITGLMKKHHPVIKSSKNVKNDRILNNATKMSRSAKNPTKGITVLDFDDTLATTKSKVNWTAPDGTTGSLTAEEYARDFQGLLAQGYKFDFTEFNVVTGGKTAPLFNKALKLAKKFGTENMFILTARPVAAQKAVHEFLKAQGLNIPLKNITALGVSTSEAKALWVAEKVGEGYNDFYFADDAIQNIQAVQNMLNQFDVKSKVQQARVKFSNSINKEFNSILENVTGIEAEKRFAATKARKRGANKGKFRFFIPPSHEDFAGLLYNFMGRGKQGDAHRSFFEKALIRPLNRAFKELDLARQSIANDYKSLNKEFPNVKDKLTKKTPDGDFTYSDAVRVYLWDKHGHNIPGLSETDQQNLVDLVASDPELQTYAETLGVVSKREDYVKPTDGWESGDIRMDLDDATGRVGRSEFFTEFYENADIIFSEENLNKIEAAYGKNVREALEDVLYRIRTGKNRPKGQNKIVGRFMNWLNASVGSVMFLNMRSAVLQQLSIVNYINFADNNIFAAAKAFANQKQYWTDWAFIFNSDMLKQRRGGIRTDVNAAELAETLKESRFAGRVLIAKLLQLGFTPTQIGDSIAIATGGATFLRNKINTYLKQGLSKKEAEAKAWTDFQDITQSTQQSARPDKVSQQQASPLGKVILNFQNITSQYNRFGKKAFSDLWNRRTTPPNKTLMQSDISNVSRVLYYIGVQNVIFYGLQTALFAAMFDDDDEDKKFFTKKKERMINGTIDSVLRGTGVVGAIVATLKNMGLKFAAQRGKGWNKDESAVLMEMLNVSPVVGIKARKITNAEKTLNYNKKVIEEMETFDIDNPQWSAVTNYVEAVTNAPVNRLYNKTQNVRQSLNNEHEAWQRVLMFLGWSQYNLGVEDTKMQEIKAKTKKKKKKTKVKIRGRTL